MICMYAARASLYEQFVKSRSAYDFSARSCEEGLRLMVFERVLKYKMFLGAKGKVSDELSL